MPALFVLGVPEFNPLVDYAEAQGDLTVTDIGDYRKIYSAAEIVIQRAATGLGEAVWFGAVTGHVTMQACLLRRDIGARCSLCLR